VSTKEQQIATLQALAKNEEAVAALYEAYAEAFPDYRDLWSNLSQAELDHAAWLRALSSLVEEGSVYFVRDRLTPEAIRTTIEYVQQGLAAAEHRWPSLIQALSMARDLERGLVERRFFEVFDEEPVELRRVMRDLSAATEEHIGTIEKAWQEARKPPGK
jgi:hypothetical protein